MQKQSQVAAAASSKNHSDDTSKVDLVEWYFEQGWTDGLPVVPPTPEKMVTWRKKVILNRPLQPKTGSHNHLRKFQFVFGKSLGLNRLPFSTTRTRYPFSASRNALTDPPNPDPTMTKSYFNLDDTHLLHMLDLRLQGRRLASHCPQQ